MINIRKENSKIVISDYNNAKLASGHFHKVLNYNVVVDWDHINYFKQKRVVCELADQIFFNKFEVVLGKLTQHKSLGLNSVSLNILKSLNKENRRVLYEFIRK